ncbi:efflux RND transporter periplasmic adaptor subunit [Clostridium sp. 'deep sea']|uniref:efflux RND transporter periplasmic adaptor subunit n=1 Tax=Clostridium sp. 'deep sea' TaxID=2779445 RepID=UPI001896502D|nr:HlyD family efflux transporter periplasmic adaptor subunit [Clostridium sp. 'deep sea']QOR34031.1 efflux RND transporter periplasmic adaptor subunit [Clostridium sp. 'deep sea']
MKKLATTLIIIVLSICVITACQTNKIVDKDPVIQPVSVKTLQNEKTDKTLNYVGTIVADDLVKYSFKTGGKLQTINVQKGDKVIGGTVLVALDKSDLQLSVNAAKAQMDAAKAVYNKAVAGSSEEDKNNAKINLQKAENAYNYSKDNLARIEKLYNAGGVSQSEYEGAQLDVDIKKATLDQAQGLYNQAIKGARQEDIDAARAQYNQAKTNYEHKKKQYNETTLVSGISGYVAEILFEAGEIVGAGYPVVVVRSENQVVNVGLSQQDVNEVKVGDKTKVKIGEETVDGVVTMISEMPNSDTRTYDTEIALLEGKFRLGMVAEVKIIVGEFEGIWIPLDKIMFSGEDFVYIVNEDKIERRSITLLETRGSKVLVDGLAEGDRLVIANSGQVKPGDKVKVVSE